MPATPSEPKPARVVHLSSAHPAEDIRIMMKECRSIADAGYDVAFVVANAPKRCDPSVRIVPVKKSAGRAGRMTLTTARVLRAGLREQADIYHFHDPELLFVGIALRLLGKKVVYDAHEDIGEQILDKEWVHPFLRGALAKGVSLIEQGASRFMSGVVAATPHIARKFSKETCITVQNFPLQSEIDSFRGQAMERLNRIVYVGAITRERGIVEAVEACGRLRPELDAEMVIAGKFPSAELLDEVKSSAGWKRVQYHEWLDRPTMATVLSQASVGVVTFHPVANHLYSQPNKLFEYMAAGVPLVLSDFPHWRRLLDGVDCGLFVDPKDAESIASAIDWLLTHPAEARRMGERGQTAVLERFHWNAEKDKLLRLYDRIGGRRSS